MSITLSVFSFLILFLSSCASKSNIGSASKPAVKSNEVVKILAIGNSFSDDALEHYLYGLADAGGHKIIIGNLYIGGAELALHWKNSQENKAAYSYRKIGVDGKKSISPKTRIDSALADEQWDYISFQQVSHKSGLYETYLEPLSQLLTYVKARVKNPSTKYVLHQTWAYSQDSKHKGFANYDNSQDKMYKGIIKSTSKVKKDFRFDLLVPSGTAIQNARTSFLGDHLTRDGYHLDLNIGRYTASCTWYEMLFKESVIGNTFKPQKISAYEAQLGQHAAHAAVLSPSKVTSMTLFKEKK